MDKKAAWGIVGAVAGSLIVGGVKWGFSLPAKVAVLESRADASDHRADRIDEKLDKIISMLTRRR